MRPLHPWAARFAVSAVLLTVGFFGLIFTNIKASGAWTFWRWAAPVFAGLALWLSWYLRRKSESYSLLSLWHELLHWLGFIGAIFLLSFFVNQGLVGRFEASLFALTLTGLSVFLAGVYIETTFLFVGILFGAFAALVAFMEEYLYAIAFLLLLSFLGGFALWSWIRKKKEPPPPTSSSHFPPN